MSRILMTTILTTLLAAGLAAEDADMRRATDGYPELRLGLDEAAVEAVVGPAFWRGGGAWDWVDEREDAHIWQLYLEPAADEQQQDSNVAPSRFLVLRYAQGAVVELKLVTIGGMAVDGSAADAEP